MPRDITSDLLQKLLNALASDEDEAALLYTKLHESLVRYFETKGLSEPDKHADDTIDRIAEKVKQGTKIEDPIKFAFGIAKFVYLEKVRRERIEIRAVEIFYVRTGATKKFDEPDEFDSFRKCFKSLYDDEQKLLIEYFGGAFSEQDFENRQKLADRERIGLNALRNKVARIRRRLEECLGKKK